MNMESRFWRTPLTYALLASGLLILVGPALSLYAGKLDHPINLVFLAGLALVAVCLFQVWRQTRHFTDSNLRRRVEVILGHSARHPLTRGCQVGDLRDGDAGWAPLNQLACVDDPFDFDGQMIYAVSPGLVLSSTPEGDSLALIFRDEDGRLHMLRFGDHPRDQVGPRADLTTCLVNDHGRVGPARFDHEAVA